MFQLKKKVLGELFELLYFRAIQIYHPHRLHFSEIYRDDENFGQKLYRTRLLLFMSLAYL